MGIRVAAGRGFGEMDREGSQRVILINQTTAARDFPGENPVGQFVYLGRDVAPWQIVGIVEDVRQFAFDQPPTGQIFADMRQWSAPFVPIFPAGAYYAVRMSGDPSAFLANARGIARQLDADAALFSIAPMESIVATTVARPRMYAVLVTLFAGVGLVLALLGVYSVMSIGRAAHARNRHPHVARRRADERRRPCAGAERGRHRRRHCSGIGRRRGAVGCARRAAVRPVAARSDDVCDSGRPVCAHGHAGGPGACPASDPGSTRSWRCASSSVAISRRTDRAARPACAQASGAG